MLIIHVLYILCKNYVVFRPVIKLIYSFIEHNGDVTLKKILYT